MSPQPWLTVTEAATYSRRHYRTVLRALQRSELRGVQRGVKAHWRTRAEWVDAWLAGDQLGARRKKTA